MRLQRYFPLVILGVGLVVPAGIPAGAQVVVQCPGDVDGDAIPDPICPVRIAGLCNRNDPNPEFDPNVVCRHLSAGDGFVVMADGRVQYMFGFGELTGIRDGDYAARDGDLTDDAMAAGMLAATWPAPAVELREGQDFYLTLTNVGMAMRPDLFDPHTVHFHGFPQASSVFDGVPSASIAINMGASLTYYYKLRDAGTFMYHCHVEATEHMQMGMLGNLYVRAGQDRRAPGTTLGTWVHANAGDWDEPPYGNFPGPEDGDLNGNGRFDAGIHDRYAYNDGDGSTRYDVDYPIQLGAFDPEFHDASWNVQPLPFAAMKDLYPMLNGRGYPDTVNTAALVPPAEGHGIPSQVEHALVTATAGERILLRLSNLNITVIHTLISPSIPMRVVGVDARELRRTDGTPLHYTTNSVSLGGGMAADVILDTQGVAPGTYFLYAANLQYLSNNEEDFGGMMTEIVINP